jgi:hypothetical protein
VVGFSDSTTYSNFEAFFAGKPELLLGTLNWINHANRWNWLNTVFLALTVILFALGIRAIQRQQRTAAFYFCLVTLAAFAFSSALFICQTFNQRIYPLPHVRIPYTKVVFEQEHGDYELPLKGFTEEREKSFEVFYQWVLRVGYYPFTGQTLEEDMQDANLLIIINPVKHFSADVLDKMKDYLQKGGKLLLMDSAVNQTSTANEMLTQFGMKIDRSRKLTLPALYSTPWMSRMVKDSALEIKGGEVLLHSEEGDPILSVMRVGEGMIAAMSFSQLFTNPPMGGSYRVVPNQQQREIYELQFNLLRGLAEGNLKNYSGK